MRRIILISLSTPTYNNMRAASGLPYHLIRGAQEAFGEDGVSFEVYSFNINHIDAEGIRKSEQGLNAKINLLPTPWWQQWMFRLHLLFLRVLLKYPLGAYLRLPKGISEEIKAKKPDIVWFYGEELAGLAKPFSDMRTIVTMPDCESMYYHRLLRKRFATQRLSQILRYAFAYWQYRSMERDHCLTDVTYHFVGKADREFFQEINPQAKAIFLRHPFYKVEGGMRNTENRLEFHTPVRIVIPGRYDIYQKEAVDELLPMLCASNDLKPHYEITFMGKGWDAPAATLKASGWTVDIKTWVDDYAAELHQHDIALYPISVGTGTKGRVLDAFANGLLVIGTPFALENIAGEHEKSCLEYHRAEEAINALRMMLCDKKKLELLATEAQTKILRDHNRNEVSRKLFE